MKKQLIALLTLAMSAVATVAHAALIDVVSFSGGLPQEYLDFLHKNTRNFYFFDEARTDHGGWVSKYGALDGGEFFFTDLMTDQDATVAEVSWDFTGTDYWLKYIDVFGTGADGSHWTHLYKVPFGFRLEDLDTVQINPDADGDIIGIAFYGTDITNVPDSGSTVALLGLSVLLLAAMRRRIFDAS